MLLHIGISSVYPLLAFIHGRYFKAESTVQKQLLEKLKKTLHYCQHGFIIVLEWGGYIFLRGVENEKAMKPATTFLPGNAIFQNKVIV